MDRPRDKGMPLATDSRRIILKMHDFLRDAIVLNAVPHPHIDDARIHARAQDMRRFVERFPAFIDVGHDFERRHGFSIERCIQIRNPGVVRRFKQGKRISIGEVKDNRDRMLF